MGANARTAPQVRALTASLRAAARGGRPSHPDRDRPGGRSRAALPLGAARCLGRGAGAAHRRRDPPARSRDRGRARAPRRRRRPRSRRRRARRSRLVHRSAAPRLLDAARACSEGRDGIRRRPARRGRRADPQALPRPRSRDGVDRRRGGHDRRRSGGARPWPRALPTGDRGGRRPARDGLERLLHRVRRAPRRLVSPRARAPARPRLPRRDDH